jgi:hypothetical protein
VCIEMPNKSTIETAVTNPPVQTLEMLNPNKSKVAETQKQVSGTPLTWQWHAIKTPIAERIATDFQLYENASHVVWGPRSVHNLRSVQYGIWNIIAIQGRIHALKSPQQTSSNPVPYSLGLVAPTRPVGAARRMESNTTVEGNVSLLLAICSQGALPGLTWTAERGTHLFEVGEVTAARTPQMNIPYNWAPRYGGPPILCGRLC